jgi:hypothetical protein
MKRLLFGWVICLGLVVAYCTLFKASVVLGGWAVS